MARSNLSLFDGQLLIPFESTKVVPQLSAAAADEGYFARLVNNLFLYDRITIPTVDFAVVAPLIAMIGPDHLIRYIEDETIRFARYRGGIAYIGAGNGLEMIEIRSPRNPPPGAKLTEAQRKWKVRDAEEDRETHLADAASQDPDEALTATLRALRLDEVIPDEIEALTKAVLDKGYTEVTAAFYQPALEEAYLDVLDNQGFRTMFGLHNTNLKDLGNLGGNQLRWLRRDLWNDEIDVLLHIAQFSLECALASENGCRDQTIGPSALQMYRAKMKRAAPSASGEVFDRVLDVSGLPDFTAAHRNDELLEELLKIRDSAAGADFRAWFDETLPDDPEEAVKRYVAELTPVGLRALPLEATARWAITTGVSAALAAVGGPGASLAAGAANALFTDRFFSRNDPPRFLISRLREAHGKFGMLDG